MASKIDEATDYLQDGGIGELIGLAEVAIRMSQPKVQMDAPMAMALCLLAREAIKSRTRSLQ